MKDYHGNHRHLVFLGILTGTEIQDKYNEMADSVDKLPVATVTKEILKDGSQTTRDGEYVWACWIYYQFKKKEKLRTRL